MIFKDSTTDFDIGDCVMDFSDRAEIILSNQVKLGDTLNKLRSMADGDLIKDELTQIESFLMNQSTYNSHGKEKFAEKFSISSLNDKEVLKRANFVRLVLVELAQRDLCTLSSGFKLSLRDQANWKTVLSYKEFYPQPVVSLLAMSTENRAQQNNDLLDSKLINAAKSVEASSGNLYKSINANSNILARCILTQGVTSLENLEAEDFITFRNGLVELGETNAISCNYMFELIDSAYNKTLLADYSSSEDSLSMPKKGVLSTSNEYVVCDGKSKQTEYWLGELFEAINGAKTVVYPDHISVPVSNKNKIVDYGYWSTVGGAKSEYSPFNFKQKNAWVVAELDFINNTKQEVASRKVTAQRLSILNSYIFDYLPAYYKLYPSIFPYPNTPKKFNAAIFLKRSEIFEYEVNLPSDFQYPVSLEQFVIDITLAGQRVNTDNNNVGRDTLSEIMRLFDYLTTISDSFEDYYLESNPLKGYVSQRMGGRPTKNSKNLFPIKYWCLLRLFTRNVAYAVLKRNLSALKTGQSISESSIVVNKKIIFEGEEIYIGTIDLSDFSKRRFKRSGKSIEIFDYQSWVHSLIISYSGLRTSNTSWLDVDTFSNFISYEEINKCLELISSDFDSDDEQLSVLDNLYEIVINTDKAKVESFSSHVPKEVFCIMLLTKSVRELNETPGFINSQYYQGNKTSKWGKIRPLLQVGNIHPRDFPHCFDEISIQFEKCLTESGMKFDTNLSYIPKLYYTKDEFHYVLRAGSLNEKACTIQVAYTNGEVPFMPLRQKAIQTPHSHRTQIDSALVPLIGEKVISELLTGQTEETVSFYTKPFNDDASQDFLHNAMSLLVKSKLISINECGVDETEFKNDVLSGVAIEKYNCKAFRFRVNNEDETSNGLDQLRLGAISELAINRTHICPFNNNCPRHVIKEYGYKNCAECAYTVTMNNQLPAIAALIRKLAEEIADIREIILRGQISKNERIDLETKKSELINKASYWYVRYEVSNNSDEIFIITKEGRQQIMKDRPKDSALGKKELYLLKRLYEVKGVEALQSDFLKKKAARLSRRIEAFAKDRKWEGSPQLSEVDEALILFKSVSEFYGLSTDEQLRLLSDDTNRSGMLLEEFQ